MWRRKLAQLKMALFFGRSANRLYTRAPSVFCSAKLLRKIHLPPGGRLTLCREPGSPGGQKRCLFRANTFPDSIMRLLLQQPPTATGGQCPRTRLAVCFVRTLSSMVLCVYCSNDRLTAVAKAPGGAANNRCLCREKSKPHSPMVL